MWRLQHTEFLSHASDKDAKSVPISIFRMKSGKFNT